MKAEQIKIAEPCKVDWAKMTPAEGGRFCADCKKVVKNLSSMTEREAKKMLRSEGNGQLCVRFVYDAQGKIFFGKDAPKADPLLPAAMLSRARRVAAAASLALASQACSLADEISSSSPAASTTSATPHPQQPETDYPQMMGGVSMDPNDRMLQDDDAGADAGADGSAGDAAITTTTTETAADGGADAATGADGGVEIY